MNDREIIRIIAEKWIELGGDSEGFDWCKKQILDKLEDLERLEHNKGE